MPLLDFRFREARRVYRHRRLIHLLARSLPRDRLIATGARVFLPTQVITMVSLVLYELGTNALKYGAVASARRRFRAVALVPLSSRWAGTGMTRSKVKQRAIAPLGQHDAHGGKRWQVRGRRSFLLPPRFKFIVRNRKWRGVDRTFNPDHCPLRIVSAGTAKGDCEFGNGHRTTIGKPELAGFEMGRSEWPSRRSTICLWSWSRWCCRWRYPWRCLWCRCCFRRFNQCVACGEEALLFLVHAARSLFFCFRLSSRSKASSACSIVCAIDVSSRTIGLGGRQ